jgi:glucose/arabinose dehydrogenase
MLIRRRLMLGALAALLFAAPIAGHAQQPADAPAARVLDVAGGQIRVVTVATGLFHPWGLGFLPDGGILVSDMARLLEFMELIDMPRKFEAS